MKKLWIHIGAHKTGTTYVQEQFARRDKELAERGILYPKTGRDFLWGHHQLVKKTADTESRAATKRQIAGEMESFEGDVFISSENFENLSADQMREVAGLFDAKEVVVIYLYRNWSPLLYSSWQEHIKHGGMQHFQEYALSNIAFYHQSKVLNFNLPVSRAESAFGSENIRIASYDAVCRQGNLVSFFFNLLGLGDVTPSGKSSLNRSLRPAVAEITRVFNRLAIDKNPLQSRAMRMHFIKNFDKRSDENVRSVLSIMDQYTEQFADVSNSAIARDFAKRFLARHAKKLLLPDDTGIARDQSLPMVVNSDYLLEPEAVPALRTLFNEVVDRSRQQASN